LLTQSADQTVHEPLPLREIAIAEPKEMMTGNDDAATGSPLQQLHRIVADAGRSLLPFAQLFVDG